MPEPRQLLQCPPAFLHRCLYCAAIRPLQAFHLHYPRNNRYPTAEVGITTPSSPSLGLAYDYVRLTG